MKKSIIFLILISIGLCSYGQNENPISNKNEILLDSVDSTNSISYKTLTFDSASFDYSESKHIETLFTTEFKSNDSKENLVVIQNGAPRGGGNIDELGRYYESSGIRYVLGIFWSRITNQTTAPLNISINLPAEPFVISKAPDAYLKFFLHPEPMTTDKLSSFNYGLSDLRSFFDANSNKPTTLNKTLAPDEEHTFFVVWLIHVPQQNGPIRAGFVLKEQELFYGISISPLGSTLIPSGQLTFEK